jgi:uncharacterized protein (DUF427 family)
VAENAAWSYETPLETASWLHGYLAIEWKCMDHWFDEDDETGGPNRHYIPTADMRTDEFTRSDTTTHCPHKGDTAYWHHAETQTHDVTWSYPTPLADTGYRHTHESSSARRPRLPSKLLDIATLKSRSATLGSRPKSSA